jgi:UDP-N-acetylglucosamine 2-epimerase (non-hydrolysing)
MIVYLIGTKAQYIKMAPVVLATRRRGAPMRLVYTGQHSETFDDLQENFGLPDPDFVLVSAGEAKDHVSFSRWLLGAWRASGSAPARAMWRGATAIVVHGDTASTMLGAWIGKRHGVPVAHVEAGLRSFSYRHPFPEELVRVAVSKIARIHFCPDPQALANLERAKVGGTRVLTPGNTMKDALRIAQSRAVVSAPATAPYAVFSMHRHENLFNRARLDGLLSVLRDMSAIIPMKFVLHPVTRKRLQTLGLLDALSRQPGLELVARMDFLRFATLLSGASFVATDGGSNQEECAMLGIPCLLLRQATERPDGLDDGVVLSNYDAPLMLDFARRHADATVTRRPVDGVSPSEVIVDHLLALSADQAGVAAP